MDRNCSIEAQGELDHEAGEFWVENPFLIPRQGKNLSAYERNRLYLNRGGGKRLLDVSFSSGADIDADSRAAIAADFNRDGAADLLVGSVGGGPLRLFQNRRTNANSRVRIILRGKKSNRSGVGARVELRIAERRIVRDMFPANGFMGQSPSELIVGLGEATKIDELSIRWPSGAVDRHENLTPDQVLVLEEGAQVETRPLAPPTSP